MYSWIVSFLCLPTLKHHLTCDHMSVRPCHLLEHVDSVDSLEDLRGRWLPLIKGEQVRERAAITLVGLKSDLDPDVRQVSFAAGREFADELARELGREEVVFCEASAKSGAGVDGVFIEDGVARLVECAKRLE